MIGVIRFLTSIFQHHCPICSESLQTKRNSFLSEKVCPRGHYKEESYSHLGVSIVYEEEK